MYSERLGPCQLLARSEGRVAFAGTVLASLQAVGFVLSLYLLVSSYTEGRVTPARLQESLAAAHTASQKIFDFYRSSIAKKFSKEINS